MASETTIYAGLLGLSVVFLILSMIRTMSAVSINKKVKDILISLKNNVSGSVGTKLEESIGAIPEAVEPSPVEDKMAKMRAAKAEKARQAKREALERQLAEL